MKHLIGYSHGLLCVHKNKGKAKEVLRQNFFFHNWKISWGCMKLDIHTLCCVATSSRQLWVRVFGSSTLSKKISDFVTVSDEAFTLLTIENNYDRWMSKFNKEEDKHEVRAKWTNSGKSAAGVGKSRKFDGWAKEGYKRFNELHHLVKLDREKWSRRQFEELLKEEFIEDCAKSLKADSSRCDDNEVVFPAHDFEDVEQYLPGENDSEDSEEEELDNKQQEDEEDQKGNETDSSDDDE